MCVCVVRINSYEKTLELGGTKLVVRSKRQKIHVGHVCVCACMVVVFVFLAQDPEMRLEHTLRSRSVEKGLFESVIVCLV